MCQNKAHERWKTPFWFLSLKRHICFLFSGTPAHNFPLWNFLYCELYTSLHNHDLGFTVYIINFKYFSTAKFQLLQIFSSGNLWQGGSAYSVRPISPLLARLRTELGTLSLFSHSSFLFQTRICILKLGVGLCSFLCRTLHSASWEFPLWISELLVGDTTIWALNILAPLWRCRLLGSSCPARDHISQLRSESGPVERVCK